MYTLEVPGYLSEYDLNYPGTSLRYPSKYEINDQVWYPDTPRVYIPYY